MLYNSEIGRNPQDIIKNAKILIQEGKGTFLSTIKAFTHTKSKTRSVFKSFNYKYLKI